MKIWCLFSIDNNYDQPDHNLCAWWSGKPSFQMLAKELNLVFPGVSDEQTLLIVNLWQGMRVEHCQVQFRLREIGEGTVAPAV